MAKKKKKRTKKYRKAYRDYLISMGITPPSSLDDEDLSNFFVNDAFNYEPGASDAGMPEAMNYGDFLLERFNNPTVKYRGDLGAYKRDMGLGGDGPKPIIYPYPISTAVAPAVAPETEVATATGNPFLPGGNLPFANYGTAAHGAQFGVDQRMFAADGGRIGYANGADYYANLYSKYAQDMIKDGNTPMPIEDFVAIIKEQEKTSKAQGGRIGYAGGGIADLRQGYFLGKLVKKATRGIKKIIKSPIGKAALLAGGAGLFGYGPAKGLFASGKGLSFKNFLADKILGTMKYGYPTEAGVRTGGLLNFLKTPKGAFTGIAALSSLPLLFGQSQEEEEGVNYADLPNIFDKYSPDQLRQMALAGTLPQNEYPFQSYYAADGGRVGLMNGGNLRAAALNQLYGINDDEDKKLLSQGGSAGLPPITSGVEGQNLQSFSDDETPMPTQQDQMPRPNPMMAGRMNPMMRGMNPMMRGMNPMMARGMGMPRMMAQEGGLMASVDDPFYRSGDEDEHSFRMFGKPYKELNADELQGSTFSISNFGVFNVTMGTPIINQPNVGILGVGVVKKRPVVIETNDVDTIGIKSMMYLSLGFDHRLIDGAGGSQFIESIRENIEKIDLESLL